MSHNMMLLPHALNQIQVKPAILTRNWKYEIVEKSCCANEWERAHGKQCVSIVKSKEKNDLNDNPPKARDLRLELLHHQEYTEMKKKEDNKETF